MLLSRRPLRAPQRAGRCRGQGPAAPQSLRQQHVAQVGPQRKQRSVWQLEERRRGRRRLVAAAAFLLLLLLLAAAIGGLGRRLARAAHQTLEEVGEVEAVVVPRRWRRRRHPVGGRTSTSRTGGRRRGS